MAASRYTQLLTFLSSNSQKLHRIGANRLLYRNSAAASVAEVRNFSGSGVKAANDSGEIHSIPLTTAVPWLNPVKYATIASQKLETQITKLDNGLRVASEPKFGHFCTVGVLIDSGSRYEVAHPSGITHFLEKLAYSSTARFPSRDDILKRLERYGGICDCQGSRDTMIYAMSASTQGLTDVVELLSEVVLHPLIDEQEIATARAVINFELDSLDMRPDPDPLLVEMIHAAAYRDNTLGLPKVCPIESVNMIDRKSLITYLNNYHTPDRMVLAGVGVEHEALVELAHKYFSSQPIWSKNKSDIDPKIKPDNSLSQYTGGKVEATRDLSNVSLGTSRMPELADLDILLVTRDLSNVSLGPTPMPELAHLVIGLESCSHKDPDFVSYCVLNMLMGGGGSFSAGGPGKGMYSRLYLNVLNRFHWIHNATAYNHAYGDSGLFCIHASAHPSNLRDLTEVVIRELVSIQHGISATELNRAKRQLQSMLMMNLETRPVLFEDIGRQVLANGHRHQPDHYSQLIDKIKEEDIVRVARRMIHSKPAVAGLGNLTHLPAYEEISTALNSKDGRLAKKFTLFR